ncbi:MAG TPA: GNAT family N-acetyltransferase [Verrucomicrobiae bacterium]|nr:GNAT family N-acetyltransferase [Verrucomicrobiae bacterium]
MNSPFTYRRVDTLPDLTGLIELYKEVFELSNFILPPSAHIQSLLENPEIVFLAAYHEGRIVGGLTAYVLPSVYAEKHEMYLYDLAILTSHQRKGIGRQLLEELKNHARGLNVSEIYVQADIVDDGALAFYRATGGIEEDVRHFGYKV